MSRKLIVLVAAVIVAASFSDVFAMGGGGGRRRGGGGGGGGNSNAHAVSGASSSSITLSQDQGEVSSSRIGAVDQLVSVPEPGTLLLLASAAGLAGLVRVRRRK